MTSRRKISLAIVVAIFAIGLAFYSLRGAFRQERGPSELPVAATKPKPIPSKEPSSTHGNLDNQPLPPLAGTDQETGQQTAAPTEQRQEGPLETRPLQKPKSADILKDMVLIPAGEFWMGTDRPEGDEDERPMRKVWVDSFYIDKYEVTVRQYRRFSMEVGLPMPPQPPWNTDNHPVVNVTWHDANRYALWVGKRLPTEAEWEKAARGGLIQKKYPWGDEEPMDHMANFADKNTDFAWSERSVNDGYSHTAPVGSYKPNPFGLYDMAGNVWEWVYDWYDSKYYQYSPLRNPTGPILRSRKVLRGGSWLYSAYNMRTSNRNALQPYYKGESGGFRCALSAPVKVVPSGTGSRR